MKTLREKLGLFMSAMLLMTICCVATSCGDDDDVSSDEVLDFYWVVDVIDSGKLTGSEERSILRVLEDTYAYYEEDVEGVRVDEALYIHKKLVDDMEELFLDDITIAKSDGTIVFTVSLKTEDGKTVERNTFTVEYESCVVD